MVALMRAVSFTSSQEAFHSAEMPCRVPAKPEEATVVVGTYFIPCFWSQDLRSQAGAPERAGYRKLTIFQAPPSRLAWT